ncbi:MAG: hypothetical protein WAS07_08090 [Micropruina sp.]
MTGLLLVGGEQLPCMARMESVSRCSASRIAAFIALTFLDTRLAFRLAAPPSSAIASCFAPTVRFSISEEAADSERSRMPWTSETPGTSPGSGTRWDSFRRGIVLHTGSTTYPLGERLWAMPIASLWQ